MTEQLDTLVRLITLTPQARWKHALAHMLDQLRLPMQDVLERVPGEYVKDKLHAIGCSRTAFYDWMRESYRPNAVQAARLAELTGLPAEQIRGHQERQDDDTGRTPAQTAKKLARSRKTAPRSHGRTLRARRRMVDAQGRGRGL